jgi:hypothetical protein
MAHVFFFSYASENRDHHLERFFDDLCAEIAPEVKWAWDDPNISFRDGKNLPLMEDWQAAIMDALQTSGVLVCMTSQAYFEKPFCGQEYYIFDQRRRQGLGAGAVIPKTVLPIIWAPVDGSWPLVDEIQWAAFGFPAIYKEKGLRYLKKFESSQYEKCVYECAQAILKAWKAHKTVEKLATVGPFAHIPNAFAGGVWTEAAGPGGWIEGPDVANFVYCAAADLHKLHPESRYGATSASWRPYHPPEARTIAQIAKSAAQKHSLRYREIPVSQDLGKDLSLASQRNNLTLVVADPQTLAVADYQPVNSFDGLEKFDGTSLLMLWDDAVQPWATVQELVAKAFPTRSASKPPVYIAPIRTAEELDKLLDCTMADLRGAMTKLLTESKKKTDEGPAQLTGIAA